MSKDFEQIESLQRQNHEVLRHHEEMFLLGQRKALMFIKELKLKLFRDRGRWVCAYEDGPEGIAGFGNNPMAAVNAFIDVFEGRTQAAKEESDG